MTEMVLERHRRSLGGHVFDCPITYYETKRDFFSSIVTQCRPPAPYSTQASIYALMSPTGRHVLRHQTVEHQYITDHKTCQTLSTPSLRGASHEQRCDTSSSLGVITISAPQDRQRQTPFTGVGFSHMVRLLQSAINFMFSS